MRRPAAPASLLPDTLVAALVAAVAAVLVCAPGARANTRFSDSSNRRVMPMIVTGADVKALSKANIASLRLYAALPDGFGPIPFQIDEKDPAGRYVFKTGGRKGTDDGLLDDNDELAFMLKDAGPSFPAAYWPKGVKRGAEIRLDDPLDKERNGYVYLFEFDSPPAMHPADYIRFDRQNMEISSKWYLTGFDPANPCNARTKRLADRTGKLGPDTMDRLKIRASAWALGSLIRFDSNEDDLKSQINAWTDGPVRVLYEIDITLKLGPIPLITTTTNWAFYEYSQLTPVHVETPGMLRLFASRIELVIDLDMDGDKGATMSANSIPQGVKIEGREADDDDHAGPRTKEGWFLISREGTHYYAEFHLDEKLPIEMTFNYYDTAAGARPPEGSPGQLPEVGYHFYNWEKLEQKSYDFYARLYFLPELPDQGGNGLFKAINQPVTAQASAGADAAAVVATDVTQPEVTQALSALSVRADRVDAAGIGRKLSQQPAGLVILNDTPDTKTLRILERSLVPVLILKGSGGQGLVTGTAGTTDPDKFTRLTATLFPKGSRLVLVVSSDPGSARQAEQYADSLSAAGYPPEILQVKTTGGLAASLKDQSPAAYIVVDSDFWTPQAYQTLMGAAGTVPVLGTSRSAAAAGAAVAIGSEFSGDYRKLIEPLLHRTRPGAEAAPVRVFINPEAIKKTKLMIPPTLMQIAERAK